MTAQLAAASASPRTAGMAHTGMPDELRLAATAWARGDLRTATLHARRALSGPARLRDGDLRRHAHGVLAALFFLDGDLDEAKSFAEALLKEERSAISHRAADAETPRFGDLTPRELDIVRLVGKGHTNPEIGAALHLSPKTVRNYLSSAFLKLGVTRRAEIVFLVSRWPETEA